MKTNIWKMCLPAIGLLALAGSVNAAENGPYCREFTQQIVVGGKVKQGYGTACLQPTGQWQIVSPAQMTDDVALQTQALPVEQPVPVQYVVQQQPVYVQPDPFPLFLSFGYSNGWGGGHRGWGGGGWHGGGGHWHH